MSTVPGTPPQVPAVEGSLTPGAATSTPEVAAPLPLCRPAPPAITGADDLLARRCDADTVAGMTTTGTVVTGTTDIP